MIHDESEAAFLAEELRGGDGAWTARAFLAVTQASNRVVRRARRYRKRHDVMAARFNLAQYDRLARITEYLSSRSERTT